MISRVLVYLGLALLGFFGAGLAHGQTVTPDWYYSTSIGGVNKYGRDPIKLCTEKVAPKPLTRTAGTVGSTTITCYALNSTGTESSYGVAQFAKCTSPKIYWDAGLEPAFACVSDKPPEPPPTCPADTVGEGTWYHSTGPEESNTNNPSSPAVTGGCVQSCQVTMTDIKMCYLADDGKNYCRYVYKTTGGVCAAGQGTPAPEVSPPAPDPGGRTDVPPFSPPSGKCPTGTVQGGVAIDGTPVCIGTGSDPKNSPPPPPKIESSKTEPTPDGGTKTTDTTTTKNSDGSTTTETKTTTTAPDGTKTVTITKDTTTTLSGAPGKDESNKDDEKYDLCKQNPMLAICRNSSVSGSCGQITCSGDAIQCATLRAAAAMQCQQEADKEALTSMPSKALGDQILSGNDPMSGDIASALKGTEVDLSKTTLDQAGFVGAGACFPDKTFTVVGKTVTVSFARVCQDIQPLRAAVMACAFIIAYLIVGRSVIQG